MSELRQILELWRSARDHREEICLATIVAVEGSSYRKPGTRMLLTSGGGRVGTISGGCLEKEVQKIAWWLTRSGPTVQKYSTFVDEDSEIPYGLGCGGTVSVLLERGEVEVRCDFCNRAYVFDAVDVAQLFNAGVASDSGSSVH